jgi:clorobiocin/coumermycin A biosynthesis protein CloN6/CouN6
VAFWKEAGGRDGQVGGPPPESPIFSGRQPDTNKDDHSMGKPETSESISADLILLHPPSIYDFRERDDIFQANLSTSDCGVTPVYEMYPLGFKSIQRFLETRGHSVRIINVASLMLRYPHLNVPDLLSKLSAVAYGIDLHWMVHVQGGLALAEELKRIHPSTPVIFGGISATYYSDELILYPQVDMVLRGYDTLGPLSQLISSMKAGGNDFTTVPNLCYKDSNRFVRKNEFTYLPENIPGIDWSAYRDSMDGEVSSGRLKGSPYVFMLTSTGCAHNCPWCGGSRDSYRRIMGKQGRTVMYKPLDEMVREVESLGDVSNTGMFIYALQWYCEPKDRIVPLVKAANKAGIKRIQFEIFNLTPQETLAEVCRYVRPTFNLSPQSHDPEISRLAGRGTYTMQQMEDWIEKALPLGVDTINVWFMIGMAKQTTQSVLETVEYCRHLLWRFKGKNVIPLICPMIPFLDPGSTFFVEPEKHGYKILHRSLEDHRKAMTSLSLKERLNYETNWMSREDMIYVSYEAVKRLVTAKGEVGMLPRSLVKDVVQRLEEAVGLIHEIDDVMSMSRPGQKNEALILLKEKVRAYNRRLLSSRTDQTFPVQRSLDSKWFDEFEYNPAAV